ncbi:hypothetical protein FACS1894217_12390 [Clostridia bacterium]|nr:hypothetical protein FACS1894217_12390 [Clostridia bacterium]
MNEEHKLQNYTEIIVSNRVAELLPGQDVCGCEQCRLDIIALALNNLPPHYVVTTKGQLFAKLESFEAQETVDVTMEITNAIEKVKSRPRHPKT